MIVVSDPGKGTVSCWCGWYPIQEPRALFATHLDWHLDRLRILKSIREVLG